MSTTATKEQKTEFTMKQVFAMWLKKSKSGKQYFSGKSADGKYLVGFLNGKKKNPKEPDVRIYEQVKEGEEQKEYCSLWMNVSKNEKKYLSGKVGDVKVVGFINQKATADGKQPYFSIYESDSTPKTKEDASGFMQVDETKEELPFK